MTKAQMLQLRLQIAGWASIGIANNTIRADITILFGLLAVASFGLDIYVLIKAPK